MRLICAAAEYAKLVDSRLNGAAICEFEAATSELQDFGADLGEGSAFLDGTSISFTAQSTICGLCESVVSLSAEGSVTSDGCPASGFCEMEWISNHPERYFDEHGELSAKKLFCGAEIGCRALIDLSQNDGRLVSVLDGVCQVAMRGGNWRERCDGAVASEKRINPEDGIEEFDGEGSGREDSF